MSGLLRLDALLSRFGFCSRSEARAWVKAGRIRVGGAVAKSPSDKASPGNVLVDGEPVEHPHGSSRCCTSPGMSVPTIPPRARPYPIRSRAGWGATRR